jgi:tetratricopeptide (TPR) repeat protein
LLKRWDEAYAVYQDALAANPDEAEVHIALAEVCYMLRRFDEAERHARAALEIVPDAMEANSNLSLTLQAQGRMDEAEAAIRSAIAQRPDQPPLYVNLGNLLCDRDDAEGAEAAYRRALELAPDHGGAHISLGSLLLRIGRYEEGWREYDWDDIPWDDRTYPQPRWGGADLTGKTILAWADEGAGDEIQFASLLPELIEQAEACIVECDKRLVPVFERSFPDAEIHARHAKKGKKLRSGTIDYQTPFSELPRWLRPNLAAAPKPEKAYLLANDALAEACRARYRNLGDGLTVGIAWSSGNASRPSRNAPLALWEPILLQPGVQFVSLQYGDHTDELAETRERFGVDIFVDPEIDQMKSLEQFAAQVAATDLVVSITNTTVHMAGALGQPVWTMLPHAAHWRYRQNTEETMWYPHMRLFRQTEPWRWDDVIARVAKELAAFRAAAG